LLKSLTFVVSLLLSLKNRHQKAEEAREEVLERHGPEVSPQPKVLQEAQQSELISRREGIYRRRLRYGWHQVVNTLLSQSSFPERGRQRTRVYSFI